MKEGQTIEQKERGDRQFAESCRDSVEGEARAGRKRRGGQNCDHTMHDRCRTSAFCISALRREKKARRGRKASG